MNFGVRHQIQHAGLNGTQVLPEGDSRCTSAHSTVDPDLRMPQNIQVIGVPPLRSQCRGRGFESLHLHHEGLTQTVAQETLGQAAHCRPLGVVRSPDGRLLRLPRFPQGRQLIERRPIGQRC